jgi:hypothetical protein
MDGRYAPTPTSGLYFDLHLDYANRRIAVEGGLDVACAPNLATAVAALQHVAPGDITVDLNQVVTGVNPQVRRIFALGGLTELLTAGGPTG